MIKKINLIVSKLLSGFFLLHQPYNNIKKARLCILKGVFRLQLLLFFLFVAAHQVPSGYL